VRPVELVEVFERILRDEGSRVQYHYVLIDYLCEFVAGETRAGSDVTELCWARADQLKDLLVPPETCTVIGKALALK
ncbi:MAG TPA: hypothetical protein VG498_21500, partial [Terriglobales bacterium]|nr:hypothetical protein [Terriglobales bacterium]